MTPLVRLDQAQVTRDASGRVVIDDPDSPVVVSITTRPDNAHRIQELTISARHPSARITPASLVRLPLAQMRHLAARTDQHPNDVVWRTELAPKPVGSRHWPDHHWDQVRRVHEWATRTGRPGGGPQAIADFWGVTRNPTAYRWIAYARRVQTEMPRDAAICSNSDTATSSS